MISRIMNIPAMYNQNYKHDRKFIKHNANKIANKNDNIKNLFELGKSYNLKLKENKKARVCVYNESRTNIIRVSYMIQSDDGIICQDSILDNISFKMRLTLLEMAELINKK